MTTMDLLIIGPGRLGLLVAQLWQRLHTDAKIHLLFRSDNPERSQQLQSQGFIVPPTDTDVKCPNVVFCAPPTGNDHYVDDVTKGMAHLSGDSGIYIFTSSGSVYGENSGGEVDENSERVKNTVGNSIKLIDSEDNVIKKNGCVLRLGGLFSESVGAHNYWGRGGQFSSKPNGLINLLHYEDAAKAVVAALQQPHKAKGQVFLVSDGLPMTRRQIADATLSSRLIKDKQTIEFTGGDDVDGKRYNTNKIRTTLDWKPSYSSFAEFASNV